MQIGSAIGVTVALLALASPPPTRGATLAPGDSIRAADYPHAANRIVGFEARLNSPDPRDRRAAVVELGMYGPRPGDDYARLLRRLVRDSDPAVAGRAIYDLWQLWLEPAPDELPPRFESSSAGRGGPDPATIFDSTSPESLRAAERQLELGDVAAGNAAYVVGLMRDHAAIPRLRRLLRDDNVYTRFAAMRALAQCGDTASAIRYLEPLPRASLNDDYYTLLGGVALVKLGRRSQGIERLKSVIQRLEPSDDVNDRHRCSDGRLLLWWLTGDETLWSQWPTFPIPSSAPLAEPVAIRASDYPRVSDMLPAFESRMCSRDPSERRDALVKLTYFSGPPDPELARFLRQLLRDPDAAVAGRAILELRKIGSPPDTSEIPMRFEGRGAERGNFEHYQFIDRSSPEVARDLADAIRPIDDRDFFRGEFQGYLGEETLYLVELLKIRAALPRLRMGVAHPEEGRDGPPIATIASLGDVAGARDACLADSTWSGADLYAAIESCHLLYRLDGGAVAARRLLRVMDRLHTPGDPNEEYRLIRARFCLYEMTGRYFADTKAARAWVRAHGVLPNRAKW